MRGLRPLLLVGLLLALLLCPGVALAHTGLLRSDPPARTVLQTPPQAVRLWFTEPVSPVGAGIMVIAPSGRQVQYGEVRADGVELAVSLAAEEEGTYLVRWQVMAADLHPASGHFTFSVGHASAPPIVEPGADSPRGLILQALARWLHFLGYALAFGPVAFQAIVLQRWDGDAVQQRLRRLLQIGIGLLLVAEPVSLLAQTTSLGATFKTDLLGDVMSTSFGSILAMRLGAALLLWLVQGALEQAGRRLNWPILLIGLALAAVDSGVSHSVQGVPGATMLLITMHVAAMGTWTGGLTALVVVWPIVVRPPERTMLVDRFGLIAAGAVAMLASSGALLAAAQLTSPSELFTTPYGRTLIAKLVGVGLALGLALLGTRAASRRHRIWTGEVWVQAVVLALAALLASLPPPR